MGGDRRQGDRRVGPSDRRENLSEGQFQDINEKTYISLTAFIVTIVVILIIVIGMILFVYNNLNNKINELNYYDDEYIMDGNYYEEDYGSDEYLYTDESDITLPDSDTTDQDVSDTTEPTTDE